MCSGFSFCSKFCSSEPSHILFQVHLSWSFFYLYQFSMKILIFILNNAHISCFYFFLQHRDKAPLPEVSFSQDTVHEIFTEKYRGKGKAVGWKWDLGDEYEQRCRHTTHLSLLQDTNDFIGKRKCKSEQSPWYPQTTHEMWIIMEAPPCPNTCHTKNNWSLSHLHQALTEITYAFQGTSSTMPTGWCPKGKHARAGLSRSPLP